SFAPASDNFQAKTLSVKSITDRQSLFDRLEVSTELQYKALVAAVSAKVRFVQSTKLDGEYIHFAIDGRVQNGTMFTAPVHTAKSANFQTTPLTPFEIDQAPPSIAFLRDDNGASVSLLPKYVKMALDNPEQFQRECGTDFVAAIFTGAQLAATLSFTKTS